MGTNKPIPVTFKFMEGRESLPNYDDMEFGIIYVSRDFGVAEHKCLCGCGEISCSGFKPEWKNGWDFIDNGDNKYSFHPSILNTNCPNKAHYFITNSVANFV